MKWLMALAFLSFGVCDTPKPLSDVEIRAALSDRYLAHESSFAPGINHRTSEQFCANGLWSGYGARVPLAGRYSVAQGQVCVVQNPVDATVTYCRRLFRDDSGQYYSQRTTPADAPLIAVRVYVVADAGGCVMPP